MDDIMDRRREIIASQPHLVTASGSAVLANIEEPKIEHLKVSFTPIQTGSGTPSPSNVRRIMGSSRIMASIGTMPVDISLGGTYYGGVVDLVSGTMTVTWRTGIFDGTETWTAVAARLYATTVPFAPVSTGASDVPEIMSSYIPPVNRYDVYTENVTHGICVNDSQIWLRCTGITTLGTLQSYLPDHPLTVSYKVATPQIVQLTPQTIAALRGQQTVTSPSGSVEVWYWTY